MKLPEDGEMPQWMLAAGLEFAVRLETLTGMTIEHPIGRNAAKEFLQGKLVIIKNNGNGNFDMFIDHPAV